FAGFAFVAARVRERCDPADLSTGDSGTGRRRRSNPARMGMGDGPAPPPVSRLHLYGKKRLSGSRLCAAPHRSHPSPLTSLAEPQRRTAPAVARVIASISAPTLPPLESAERY